jgi:hypothetical protein
VSDRAADALSLDAYERVFAAHGGTDAGYLRRHWPRFRATKALVEQTWRCKGGRVLDLGAHWLHQSLLFALDGYRVTAVFRLLSPDFEIRRALLIEDEAPADEPAARAVARTAARDPAAARAAARRDRARAKIARHRHPTPRGTSAKAERRAALSPAPR